MQLKDSKNIHSETTKQIIVTLLDITCIHQRNKNFSETQNIILIFWLNVAVQKSNGNRFSLFFLILHFSLREVKKGIPKTECLPVVILVTLVTPGRKRGSPGDMPVGFKIQICVGRPTAANTRAHHATRKRAGVTFIHMFLFRYEYPTYSVVYFIRSGKIFI